MSRERLRSTRCHAGASLLVLAAATWTQPASADAEGARTLTASDVAGRILDANPTVLAALADCRGGASDVIGLAARDPFTFQFDGALTRSVTPLMVPRITEDASGAPVIGTDVTTVRQDMLGGGLGLKKHLIWGTDLSLRFEANRQTSTQFYLVGPGVPGADADGNLRVSLGPGYGAALKLAATQPLLRGAGREVGEADLRAARARLTVLELTHQETASAVLRDALTAFWELWYASAAVDIARRARDAARDQRDGASERLRTGSLAPADLAAFQTQLAAREEDLVDSEAEQARRRVELARLLDRVDDPEMGQSLPDNPDEPPELEGDLRAQAIEASSKIRTLAAEVKLAATRAATAGEPLRPRLDLDGNVQVQGLVFDDMPAALRQVVQAHAVSAHVGLTFELPLDNTQHRMARAGAQDALQMATEKLEAGRQEVLAAVDTARLTERAARQRVALARETRDLARRQANMEKQRLATGGATTLDVLQAQGAVRAAELRLARAQTDVIQAHISLAHQVGLLLRDTTRVTARGTCALR